MNEFVSFIKVTEPSSQIEDDKEIMSNVSIVIFYPEAAVNIQ